MKVTYIQQIESHTALSRKMYCPRCGSHCYEVVGEQALYGSWLYWIQCEECGHVGPDCETRAEAFKEWKRL